MCTDPDAVTKEMADTPEHEIEVTLEMIEAGVDALDPTTVINLRDGWISPADVARKVYVEVAKAASQL